MARGLRLKGGSVPLPSPTGGIYTAFEPIDLKAFWGSQWFLWVLWLIIAAAIAATIATAVSEDSPNARVTGWILDIGIAVVAFITYIRYAGGYETITQRIRAGLDVSEAVCGGIKTVAGVAAPVAAPASIGTFLQI